MSRRGCGSGPLRSVRASRGRRDNSRQIAGRATERAEQHCVEFVFLPGLEDVVRTEITEQVAARNVFTVPERRDAIQATWSGSLRPLFGLRTIVAAYLVVRFDIPRPRSLLSGEHFPRLLAALHLARSLDPVDRAESFRFEAAGRDSTVFRLLAEQLVTAAGMVYAPEDGASVIRFRRTTDRQGWDVLVRLGVRPLSARRWRHQGYRGAVNATVAAAMVRLTDPQANDRVVNLMCGSGTLLVERLLAAPARVAVGVDVAKEAIWACGENLAGAGLKGRALLFESDIADDAWVCSGPFDVMLADPPWGDKIGHHDTNEELHMLLLSRAYDVGAPGARFAVLTHEIRVMANCLERFQDRWLVDLEQKVFHKGHHPRIYLLRRVACESAR